MTNLNKLYGYNKKYFKFKENLKKNKDDNLEKYQDDILRLSSLNLCRDNLLKLYTDLKNLRLNSEETKPLPPINFQTLISHSLNEKKPKKGKDLFNEIKNLKIWMNMKKKCIKLKLIQDTIKYILIIINSYIECMKFYQNMLLIQFLEKKENFKLKINHENILIFYYANIFAFFIK